jgi:hypothetical protein
LRFERKEARDASRRSGTDTCRIGRKQVKGGENLKQREKGRKLKPEFRPEEMPGLFWKGLNTIIESIRLLSVDGKFNISGTTIQPEGWRVLDARYSEFEANIRRAWEEANELSSDFDTLMHEMDTSELQDSMKDRAYRIMELLGPYVSQMQEMREIPYKEPPIQKGEEWVPEIAIVLEGGLVQRVATRGPGLVYRIIDLDAVEVGEMDKVPLDGKADAIGVNIDEFTEKTIEEAQHGK